MRQVSTLTRHDVRVPKTLGDSLAALAGKWRENAGGWSQYFDYSVESAVVVDNFIDRLLSTGEEISDLQQMGIGAYVGEVIRRSTGGEWVAMPKGPTPGDPGLQINGVSVLPFEKVRKRIALGASHSVGYFVQEFVATVGLPTPERETAWSKFRRKRE